MSFHQRIQPHVEAEMQAALARRAAGDAGAEFRHLERAHVLGQASTRHHVLAHVAMLRWAVRHRKAREVLGQLMRIVGAATKTALGWVPTGNTGGANVSPFKPMPLPPDLEAILRDARR